MANKIYITNENIKQYAKIKGTTSMVERDEVVLMWDELDREGKRLARNHIEIDDITVITSDPYNVPDKWNDNIKKEGEEMQAPDIIKQVIANPSRVDVFDLLMEQDPPVPLMLWWVNVCFSDPDYFKHLAEVCHKGLFKTDSRYIWGTMAFGVEDGRGKFHWPSNDDGDSELMKEVIEKLDAPEKEVRLAWDSVEGFAEELLDDRNAESDGNTDDSEPTRGTGGLL